MGLKKIQAINSVLNAEYWNIIHFAYDERTKSIGVRLGLYLNEESAHNGDDPFKAERFNIPGIEKSDDMSYEAIYQKLEQLYGFERSQED